MRELYAKLIFFLKRVQQVFEKRKTTIVKEIEEINKKLEGIIL